ncbi:MAG: hypothetical protein ACI91J_002498, partial [Yoonia sp.]
KGKSPASKAKMVRDKVNHPVSKAKTVRDKVNHPVSKAKTARDKVNNLVSKAKTARDRDNNPGSKARTVRGKDNNPVSKAKTARDKVRVDKVKDRASNAHWPTTHLRTSKAVRADVKGHVTAIHAVEAPVAILVAGKTSFPQE